MKGVSHPSRVLKGLKCSLHYVLLKGLLLLSDWIEFFIVKVYCEEGTECRLLWFYRSERCRRPPLPQPTPAAVAEMDSYWSCGVFACDSTLFKGLCCIFVCYGALGAEWLLPCHSTIGWTLNLQLSAALGAMQQAPLQCDLCQLDSLLANVQLCEATWSIERGDNVNF